MVPQSHTAKALAFPVHTLVIAQVCSCFYLSPERVREGLRSAARGGGPSEQRRHQTAVLSSSVKNSGAGRWADRRLPDAFGDGLLVSFCSAVLAWRSSPGRCLVAPRWQLHRGVASGILPDRGERNRGGCSPFLKSFPGGPLPGLLLTAHWQDCLMTNSSCKGVWKTGRVASPPNWGSEAEEGVD